MTWGCAEQGAPISLENSQLKTTILEKTQVLPCECCWWGCLWRSPRVLQQLQELHLELQPAGNTSVSARNPPEQLQFSAPVRAAALSTSPAAPRLLLTPKLITECRMAWFSSTTLRCVAVMLPVLLWHLHQLRGNTNHGNEHFWGSSDRLGFAKPGFPSDPPSSAMLGQLGLGDLSLWRFGNQRKLGSTLFFFFSVKYQREKAPVFLAG